MNLNRLASTLDSIAAKLCVAVLEKAKKHFGVTTSLREAGYILPDGTLLDLSGKNDGGTPGMRSYDHRDVGQVQERGGTRGMLEFMDKGAIRMDGNAGSLDMVKAPTESQIRQISKLVQMHHGAVIVDMANGIGKLKEPEGDDPYYSVKGSNAIFETGTRPSKVIGAIRQYYGL